jgi:hypothetical protein
MNENTLSRVSIELPIQIHRQLKIKAATINQTMREVITKLLEDFLKE